MSAPDAWRYRYSGRGKKWTVQKNKPAWYRQEMRDVELEPLFSLASLSEPTTAMLRALLVHRGYDPDAKEETLDAIGNLDIATMGSLVAAYKAILSGAAPILPLSKHQQETAS